MIVEKKNKTLFYLKIRFHQFLLRVGILRPLEAGKCKSSGHVCGCLKLFLQIKSGNLMFKTRNQRNTEHFYLQMIKIRKIFVGTVEKISGYFGLISVKLANWHMIGCHYSVNVEYSADGVYWIGSRINCFCPFIRFVNLGVKFNAPINRILVINWFFHCIHLSSGEIWVEVGLLLRDMFYHGFKRTRLFWKTILL